MKKAYITPASTCVELHMEQLLAASGGPDITVDNSTDPVDAASAFSNRRRTGFGKSSPWETDDE